MTAIGYIACLAGAWKKRAQERMGRKTDTRGKRQRLPQRPMKIVSRPLSDYLAAACVICQTF